MLHVVIDDFRFAIRGLLKRRGFTTGGILTLALGIGANSAVFSVVNAVLLSDLPYKDPSGLMIIWNDYGKTGQSLPRVSVPDFVDYREDAQTFEDFAAALENVDTLTENGESEHVDKSMVPRASLRCWACQCSLVGTSSPKKRCQLCSGRPVYWRVIFRRCGQAA